MEKPSKRRNSEKRKEKSRDAARCRRSRETEIFTSLARGLPLPDSVVNSLDKASVMRLVISYLKLNDLVSRVPKNVSCPNGMYDSLFLKALEGFVLIVSTEGDLVYLSENANEYLGLTQVDMMGTNIYEFSHPCDHDEIREVLTMKSSPENTYRSLFVRLKCTLTNKGRSVNLKSASYKVMHCSGQMVSKSSLKNMKCEGADDGKDEEQYLVAVAEPIPHPSNIEIPLDKQTFLSKHSLDMKFTYADDKMAQFLGYSPDDLLGKSLYEFQHALDSPAVDKPFKTLFTKGQCETGRYRFLAKGGGYAWVLTQATVIFNNKGQKPSSVVCVNFIVSGIENRDEIYASSQLIDDKVPQPVSVSCSIITRNLGDVNETEPDNQPAHVRPQPATAKIFAPRTEDMNKGFLMFSDDEPGLTLLKDEPEDLTHLAPTAGDVCVPLDLPHLGDMFGDILSDSFCPLLADDLSSSSCPSRTSGDPFFSYRDDSDSAQSPSDLDHLDRRIVKSPGDCSLPSLCSPEHDEEQIGLIGLHVDSGGSELDEDLCLKAPFIPIDEDLPLLIPAVDMMWSSSPSPPRPEASSLAELLRASPEPGRHSRSTIRTDHDWFRDTGQAKSSKLSPLSLGDNLLRKAPQGVGLPLSERTGIKRAHGDVRDSTESRKRARSDLQSQLFQQLVGPAEPPRSHSVLMNLLDRVPKENLDTVMEALKQLLVASSERRVEEKARQRDLRSRSTALLEPGTSAIPSLADLSERDCEVNAPVDKNTLLQGQDLLTALDYADSLAV